MWGVGTHFLRCTCYHSCVARIARNCGFFWTQSSRGVFEHTWVLAKGVAYINGYNIGRYWPSMGPQLTLYVPGWPLTRFFKILSGNLGRTTFCLLFFAFSQDFGDFQKVNLMIKLSWWPYRFRDSSYFEIQLFCLELNHGFRTRKVTEGLHDIQFWQHWD